MNQRPGVGGLAAGFKEPGWDWSVEHFYHHWFQTISDMLGLIDELGLQDKVVFPQPKTVVYHKGNFYPLDSALAALTFPGFTLRGYGAFWLCDGVPALSSRLETAGKIHRGRVDAQVLRRKAVSDACLSRCWRANSARTTRRSTWPGSGRASRRAPPAGHLRGRLPGFCRCLCRHPARARGGYPPEHAGRAHRTAAGREIAG